MEQTRALSAAARTAVGKIFLACTKEDAYKEWAANSPGPAVTEACRLLAQVRQDQDEESLKAVIDGLGQTIFQADGVAWISQDTFGLLLEEFLTQQNRVVRLELARLLRLIWCDEEHGQPRFLQTMEDLSLIHI